MLIYYVTFVCTVSCTSHCSSMIGWCMSSSKLFDVIVRGKVESAIRSNNLLLRSECTIVTKTSICGYCHSTPGRNGRGFLADCWHCEPVSWNRTFKALNDVLMIAKGHEAFLNRGGEEQWMMTVINNRIVTPEGFLQSCSSRLWIWVFQS